MGTRATATRASSARPHQMAGIVEGMGDLRGVRGGWLRRAGRKARCVLKVTFSAGDVAAPARSPKPPR
ncbi:hypothetical protein D9M72_68770 [compost metagenome]